MILEKPTTAVAVLQLVSTDITSPEDFKATAMIRNYSDEPVHLNTYVLGIASLSLQLAHANGKTMRLFPPPVPDSGAVAAGAVLLAPGDSVARSYESLPVSEELFQRGRYKVRVLCHADSVGKSITIVSDWVEFTRK